MKILNSMQTLEKNAYLQLLGFIIPIWGSYIEQ